MGTELAPVREWSHDLSLDWHLHQEPARASFSTFLSALGHLYADVPCFWREDVEPHGFEWLDASDAAQSIVSYQRRAGDEHVVVVLNLTPTPREDYRIGVPSAGRYVERFSSDDPRFGGSGLGTLAALDTDPVAMHGHAQSLALRLPPLGAIVLAPAS
jgi:1,4-alpha-glucan branching enzyme